MKTWINDWINVQHGIEMLTHLKRFLSCKTRTSASVFYISLNWKLPDRESVMYQMFQDLFSFVFFFSSRSDRVLPPILCSTSKANIFCNSWKWSLEQGNYLLRRPPKLNVCLIWKSYNLTDVQPIDFPVS